LLVPWEGNSQGCHSSHFSFMPCILICNLIFKRKSFWLLHKKQPKFPVSFLGSTPTYKIIRVLQNVNSFSWTSKFIKLLYTSWKSLSQSRKSF
jgi:hypothetical protein